MTTLQDLTQELDELCGQPWQVAYRTDLLRTIETIAERLGQDIGTRLIKRGILYAETVWEAVSDREYGAVKLLGVSHPWNWILNLSTLWHHLNEKESWERYVAGKMGQALVLEAAYREAEKTAMIRPGRALTKQDLEYILRAKKYGKIKGRSETRAAKNRQASKSVTKAVTLSRVRRSAETARRNAGHILNRTKE